MVATKLFLFPLLIFVSSFIQTPTFASKKKSYVVYFGGHSHGPQPSSIDYERVTNSHYEFLASFVGSKEKAKNAIFYSYTKHVNGFAAVLEEEEADQISKHPDVISVFRNKMAKLHTTRSWEFLGLEKNGVIPEGSLWRKARFGENIIIGNLDSGVWPESESFNDDGMGPIPKRWKGSCDSAGGVRCKWKLIGARYIKEGYEAERGPIKEILSARDTDGHGTHTLSTAGGGSVPRANVFGYGNGTAKGGSTNARVAAYKVCWPECSDADLLAGFEAAISDGVDVLSVSIGGPPEEYFQSGIAIGSFHAVKNGIPVICSAGNSGPDSGTVENVAPWIITVGASTMDREFPSYVQLGNNKLMIKGQSLSETALPVHKSYPMIKSWVAKSAKSTVLNASQCLPGSLDPKKVKGKIVVCIVGSILSTEKGDVVKRAGGVGAIIINDPTTDVMAKPHLLPALDIGWDDSLALLSYINTTASPTAYITRPTMQLGTKPAPTMAAFSSRGPNHITPEILKPDITAPGVDVLAAYTQYTGPSDLSSYPRRVLFNVISGTSMSCPHIAGIVGLLKAVHPEWSPSAIKSAIMTTAQTKDNTGVPMRNSSLSKDNPFGYGAGHVHPNRAVDPGLVYDLTVKDYLNFVCAIGYNKSLFKWVTSEPYSCNRKSLNLLNFNYPSITIPHLSGLTTVSRTVKNVGDPSTYTARIHAPPGISVSVKPMSLKFGKIGEEKTFKVSVLAEEGVVAGEYVFGKLIWSDGKHYVRSPIVVKVENPKKG